jgi:hypothetical protein
MQTPFRQKSSRLQRDSGGFLRELINIPLRPGTYVFEVKPTEFGPNLPMLATELVFTSDAREADIEG